MKYISVLIFVLLMIVTWSMSQGNSSVEMQQHKRIEAGFEDFVRSSIQKQIPNVKDIVFRQLFTETVRANEAMKAHFRYDVVAPTQNGDLTAQTVEGSVTMESKDQGQNWTIIGEEVSSPTIRFEEGIHISPRDTTDDESAAGAAAQHLAPAAAGSAGTSSTPTTGEESGSRP